MTDAKTVIESSLETIRDEACLSVVDRRHWAMNIARRCDDYVRGGRHDGDPRYRWKDRRSRRARVVDVVGESADLGLAAVVLAQLNGSIALDSMDGGLAQEHVGTPVAWRADNDVPPSAATDRRTLDEPWSLTSVVNATTGARLLVPGLGAVILGMEGATIHAYTAPCLAVAAVGEVRVPLRRTTLDAGAASVTPETSRAEERVLAAQTVVRFLHAVVTRTIAFTGERTLRDSVMRDFQVVRHALAEMWARVLILEADVRTVDELIDRGDGRSVWRAALAALHAALTAGPIVEQCAQLHGARGYMLDTWIGRARGDVGAVECLLGTRPALIAQLQRHGSTTDESEDRLPSRSRWSRQWVRQTIADVVSPAVTQIDHTGSLPRPTFQALGTAGLLGVVVSQRYGGGGQPLTDLIVVAEEFARARALSVGVSVLVAANTVCPLLERLASDGMRKQWLPRIASGACVPALAATEEGSGSALPYGIATRAHRTAGGWMLSGEKQYITNAPIADVLLVVAATAPGAGPLGLSLFLVPADAAGVAIASPHRKVGLHGSPTGRVRFDDVALPADALVGRAHLAFGPFARVMAGERLLVAAGATALARSCIDDAEAELGVGTAGGGERPCAELWEMRAVVEGCATFVHRAAALDETHEDRLAYALAAKATVVDACRRVIARCVEMVGVEARLRDDRWGRVVSDAAALSVFAGASEAMRDALANTVLRNVSRSAGRPR